MGILAVGLALGIRHALDPDHVVAITTIASRVKGVTKAAMIGAMWGIGHTLTIFVVGSAIILLKFTIPPRIGLAMEFSVGVMLVALGVFNLTGAANKLRDLPAYNAIRPMAVGIVHGLAGSAAVALIVLAAIGDSWWALAYLLTFGFGTILGMMVMTILMVLPAGYAAQRFHSYHRGMTLASGALSVAFGILISYQTGIAGGLFTANPVWVPR